MFENAGLRSRLFLEKTNTQTMFPKNIASLIFTIRAVMFLFYNKILKVRRISRIDFKDVFLQRNLLEIYFKGKNIIIIIIVLNIISLSFSLFYQQFPVQPSRATTFLLQRKKSSSVIDYKSIAPPMMKCQSILVTLSVVLLLIFL